MARQATLKTKVMRSNPTSVMVGGHSVIRLLKVGPAAAKWMTSLSPAIEDRGQTNQFKKNTENEKKAAKSNLFFLKCREKLVLPKF